VDCSSFLELFDGTDALIGIGRAAGKSWAGFSWGLYAAEKQAALVAALDEEGRADASLEYAMPVPKL
jgi:hypothetical protein